MMGPGGPWYEDVRWFGIPRWIIGQACLWTTTYGVIGGPLLGAPKALEATVAGILGFLAMHIYQQHKNRHRRRLLEERENRPLPGLENTDGEGGSP